MAPLSAEVACDSRPCYGVDGLFPHALSGARRSKPEEIDRSIAIVVEAAQNLNRAIFSLKSKAKKFDGLAVGFRPSEEIFCAYKTARYDALRGSSGNNTAAARAFGSILSDVLAGECNVTRKLPRRVASVSHAPELRRMKVRVLSGRSDFDES
ncbi:MAG: hypothetical protein WC026_11910 [Hyphomicrobium sp.]|uniref:hypothetical protein n=1 Tax=Hyphomicrobium sp. TaxID=82 RepID=UPI003562137B